jgi:ABC-2 type transport system permease protein
VAAVALRRVGHVLGKDLQLGPRSPLLLWALALPIVMTLLFRGVFGGLFASEPRLGIVDLGASALVPAAADLDGIDVRMRPDVATLRAEVEAGDLDAGLVLPSGFDAAVLSGDRPRLDLVVGGGSLASDRILLGVTTLDLVRGLSDSDPPIDVEVVVLGDPGVPFDLRLLPMLVMMAVAIAGGMVPAAGVVEEKEKGTLQAVLVTPTSMTEFLLAKGILGVLLALSAGVITLAMNGVLTAAPLPGLLAIVLGGIMMAQIGLIAGAWAPDTNTLFAAWKLGGMVLLYPVVFFLWPELPTWIARLGPTYYVLEPVWATAVEGATLADVGPELAVAAAICVALLPATVVAGRWLEGRLGTGTATTSATIEG